MDTHIPFPFSSKWLWHEPILAIWPTPHTFVKRWQKTVLKETTVKCFHSAWSLNTRQCFGNWPSSVMQQCWDRQKGCQDFPHTHTTPAGQAGRAQSVWPQMSLGEWQGAYESWSEWKEEKGLAFSSIKLQTQELKHVPVHRSSIRAKTWLVCLFFATSELCHWRYSSAGHCQYKYEWN